MSIDFVSVSIRNNCTEISSLFYLKEALITGRSGALESNRWRWEMVARLMFRWNAVK